MPGASHMWGRPAETAKRGRSRGFSSSSFSACSWKQPVKVKPRSIKSSPPISRLLFSPIPSSSPPRSLPLSFSPIPDSSLVLLDGTVSVRRYSKTQGCEGETGGGGREEPLQDRVPEEAAGGRPWWPRDEAL
jgi:hypothetical protein